MNLQIRMKLLVPAIFLIFAVEVFLAARASRAADDCISKPNTAPPQGSHWYYRVDRNHRQCWYLGEERVKVRPQQQQTTSTLRSPSSPKLAGPPAPQTTTVAAAAPVTTTVIKVLPEKNSTAEMSLVKASGFARPDDILGDALLIASKRADERSAAEISDGAVLARPIAIASETTTAQQPDVFAITFAHLAAVLVAVLACVAIIGRTIFRLSRIRRPGRTKLRNGSNNAAATTRHADIGRVRKPVMPQSSAAVAEIEQSVRRLLHELHRRQHLLDGEAPTRATDLDSLFGPLLRSAARQS
jgi:hypothetical protein